MSPRNLVLSSAVVVCLGPALAGAQDLPVKPPQIPARIEVPPVASPAPAADAAIPSFSQLFRSVGTDFRNLPSKENAVLLSIGGALAAAGHQGDERLRDLWGASSLHGGMSPGSIAGNSYLHLGSAFALYAIGRGADNTRLGRFGADLARAQIVTQATTYAVKYAAGRTRPNGDPRSFPSGHTATVFATATVVRDHFGWKAGIPAYALAAYVGASRIQDNKHYMSDVIFGATLGVVGGRTVTIGTRNVKFAMTPVSGPGGGVGIGFTRVQ
jgi:membrane-associated phospholipid phosphatase